jgi:glycosyltransferase involved in cell wall biosynthesis
MVEKDSLPLVSIIMPTYNRAIWISRAIDSVRNQNFDNWELLIIDNESTDNTRNVVDQYVKNDPRIKYFNVRKSTTPGISEYLNYGLTISGGDFIARLDDDDEWYDPDKLLKQVDFLLNNRDYLLVGGGSFMVNENRKEIYKWRKRETDSKIRKNALFANPFSHNTVLFRKKEVMNLGGYKPIPFVEDWDLWLRLGNVGKFYNFPQYFSLYMNAGQNLMVKNQKLAAKTILRLIKDYKNQYPNYKKAFVLNYFQYLFSFLPVFIKKRIQNFLFFVKRNYF